MCCSATKVCLKFVGSEDALRDETTPVSATDYGTKEVLVDADSMSSNGILENLPLPLPIDEVHFAENVGAGKLLQNSDDLCGC